MFGNIDLKIKAATRPDVPEPTMQTLLRFGWIT